jgi:cation diffusion facilitator CzcD-associated flavoprotein CzcO
VAIIGAGLGGIAVAVGLKRAGIDTFTIFEKASGPGGVWYHNSYPGCEVDVPSRAYSFSFMPYDWSGTYAKQPELRQYAEDVVDRFSLAAHVRYDTEIVHAMWNERTGCYTLTTASGDTHEAEVCISAVGLLSNPKLSDWPGLDTFEGPVFHTAEFDDTVDLEGKTVALVGTGSSAAQIGPAIAASVGELLIYQREPGHVLPKRGVTYDDATRARYRRFPILQRVERAIELFRGVKAFRATDPANPEHERVEQYFRRRLERVVEDPATRAALTPGYPYGCKRPIFANGYYEMFNRSNVELVPHAVTSVTPTGLVDATGRERQVDVVILATGFHVADFLSTLQVRGEGDQWLADYWGQEPWAFLGLTVPGFPNFAMMYGPNTNGVPSIISYHEVAADAVVGLVKRLRRSNSSAFRTRRDMARRVDDWTQKQLAKRRKVAFAGCHNYNLAPTGRNVSQWPLSHYVYGLLVKMTVPLGVRLESTGRASDAGDRKVPVATDA